MDLLADPKAAPIVKEFLQRNSESKEERSETAQDAISDEMNLAMLNYMPLRAMFGLGGRPEAEQEVLELLKQLNQSSVANGS